MDIDKLFEDRKYLNKKLDSLRKRKQIREIEPNPELVKSHIQKAKHNFKFFKLSKKQDNFQDWLIVILYYSLYHCLLALITNKNFTSKNHNGTILLVIREYSTIPKSDIKLIEELSIKKEDAKFYTNLKTDRHNANYSTHKIFTKENIEKYVVGVIYFMNKIENILDND